MSLQARYKKKPSVSSPAPQSFTAPRGLHDEQHYTVPQLAKRWGLSDDTIRGLFENEVGVLKIARPERMNKRRYVTLSVPESVAQRVHERLHGVAA